MFLLMKNNCRGYAKRTRNHDTIRSPICDVSVLGPNPSSLTFKQQIKMLYRKLKIDYRKKKDVEDG